MNLIYRLPPNVVVALGGIAIFAVAFTAFVFFPLPTMIAGAVGVILVNRYFNPRKINAYACMQVTPPSSIISQFKPRPIIMPHKVMVRGRIYRVESE